MVINAYIHVCVIPKENKSNNELHILCQKEGLKQKYHVKTPHSLLNCPSNQANAGLNLGKFFLYW